MQVYKKLMNGSNLNNLEVPIVMDGLLNERYSHLQKGAILTALSVKGETITEIGEGVKFLRNIAKESPIGKGAIDIVGTGGDGLHTINISTASSFVVAGSGVNVLKHGNRSVSSKSGSSDVLEALGIDVVNQNVEKGYEDTNLGFLYAPVYHSSLKNIGPIRKELGVRSIFNIMGPLANPSSPEFMLLGVYKEELMEDMARLFPLLGVRRGMVVHGLEDGADEISISGPTKVIEIDGSKVKRYSIYPEQLGINIAEVEEISGGTPEENAKDIIDVFKGDLVGPKKDVLILNSACALYIAERVDTILEGIAVARETIESGKAYEKLKSYVEASK